MSDQDCTPLDLPAVKERREAALRQVFGLCGGPATFTISIPSQETDSDVLLRAALEDSVRLEAELTAARDKAAELRAAIREWVMRKALVDAELARDDPPEQLDEYLFHLGKTEHALRRLAGNEEGEQ